MAITEIIFFPACMCERTHSEDSEMGQLGFRKEKRWRLNRPPSPLLQFKYNSPLGEVV